METQSKPKWNHTWMAMAEELSKRSVDPRLKVGCLIVSDDNDFIESIGYNGDERGGSNAPDSNTPGESGFVHAEINALIKRRRSFFPAKLYVTHSPCVVCARAIVNAGGIMDVYYRHEYRDRSGLELLNQADLRLFQVLEGGKVKVFSLQAPQ
jgi:dCMP deaminase